MEGETDVIIVGGGPAGLSAALLLGRCCRRVLLFDDGLPRNRASKAVHGFLSRDGIAPGELRRVARKQVRAYSCVALRKGRVVAARKTSDGFEVRHENGEVFHARKLLLATGVKDVLPDLPGLDRFYGRSAFHCPFCDGWEQRDQPLVIYGRGQDACAYALELFCWSKSLTICTDGTHSLTRAQLKRLQQLEIRVLESRVTRLTGRGRQLANVWLEDGTRVACHALFFCSNEQPQSNLGTQLGAAKTDGGRVKVKRLQATGIPGLYVAGNSAPGVQLVVVAAAEGAEAAYAINEELNQENLESFESG